MQNISYDQIIAILGLSIWFIFPFGMFISVMRQDREAMPAPQLNPKHDENEHLKIFEHKKMLYDESEDIELSEVDISDESIEEPSRDDEYNHPHTGIGSTHVHHIH